MRWDCSTVRRVWDIPRCGHRLHRWERIFPGIPPLGQCIVSLFPTNSSGTPKVGCLLAAIRRSRQRRIPPWTLPRRGANPPCGRCTLHSSVPAIVAGHKPANRKKGRGGRRFPPPSNPQIVLFYLLPGRSTEESLNAP